MSKKIYKVTKAKIDYDEGKKIKIKGFEGGFPTYSPVKVVTKVRKSLIDLKAEHSSMIGRLEELQECINWAGKRVTAKQSGMVIIQAAAGLGKSVFVEELAIQGSKFDLSPLIVMGSEVEQTTPFQAVQGIISDIICEKINVSKVDDINYQSREVERVFQQPTDRIICR